MFATIMHSNCVAYKTWDNSRGTGPGFYNFLFVSFVLYVNSGYALNLDKIKVHFLAGDYKSAILEGEKLLAGEAQSGRSDELYYILGLSYLKDGNYLRASDIFEIILKEFKNSAFKEEASLGLGDTYFLKGDYGQAEGYFRELINNNPATKLKAQVCYRLSLIGFNERLSIVKTSSKLIK